MKMFNYEDILYVSVKQTLAERKIIKTKCFGCAFDTDYQCTLDVLCILHPNIIYKKLDDNRKDKIRSLYEDNL